MTEESIQPPTQWGDPQIPPSSTATPPTRQLLNKKVWIIGSVVIVAGLCLCSVACLAMLGISLFRVNAERQPVSQLLDAYMRYMSNKDVEAAYALFSPRAQRQMSYSELEKMLEGNNYILFEGYQSLEVSELRVEAVAHNNPDAPQGIVATAKGVITFEGGIQGTFNGVLEKVGDTWMLDDVYVTVPPDKLQDPYRNGLGSRCGESALQ